VGDRKTEVGDDRQALRLLESAPRWVFDWIGSTAAVCTTISFVPQLLRVWRRKSARDISLIMFLLFSFGVTCWLVYGIGIGSRPIVAANAITLALSVAILMLKLRYDLKTGNRK
jgi:MtN3 and saliva related transmembrane protein